ncbi:MAG TPA: gliding motility-associated C-terminal domain-containing protein, partial [Prolixibacteraceae bacterium]|nr:gliding motility-associated C-terminal domain-containing protein [Prolixibacteraceae bacterium]
IVAGSQITYTIEVSNLSPSMKAESVIITDNINSEYVEDSKYSVDGGLSWFRWRGSYRIDSLKYGEVFTLQIQGYVPSNKTGNILNTASVSADTPDADNTNNASTVITEIITQANIEVIKELYSSVDDLKSGSEIVYRITYKNYGPSDAINFTMNDAVPEIITNVEASRCESGFVPWNGSANMGTVVAGGQCTVLIKGTIGSDLDGSITNTVTVSSDIYDPDLDNNTSSVTHNVVASADLNIDKWASETAVWIGSEFKYTVVVTNNGLSDAHDVVVTDVLPNELELLQLETETGSWTSPNWNVGLLKNGESVTMNMFVRVKNNAQQGFIIRNTAVVASSTFDPDETNNTATRIIYVNAGADIAVQKNVDKNVVEAGDTLIYTIVVSNNGPSDAYDVFVEDVIRQGLTVIDVNLSGGSWTLPKWTIGTLLSGETLSMQIIARVNVSLPNETVIDNTATVYSSTTDPDYENNTSTVTTIVSSDNEYIISKTASVSTVKAGDEFSYSINVENLGPSNVQNFMVTDQLPPQLQLVETIPQAQFSNGILLWNIEDFVVGIDKVFNITVRVQPNTTVGTSIRNVAIGISDEGDSIESNQSIVTVVPDVDLAVNKMAHTDKVFAGDKIIYTINVQNNGNSDLHNVIVNDQLPAGVAFVSASHSGVLSGNIVQWSIPQLAANSSMSVTLEVLTDIALPHRTVIYNTAIVTSDETDEPEPSNEIEVLIEGFYQLEINKTAATDSVFPGDVFTYHIDLVNNGPGIATNISVVDQLPSELAFVSANYGGVYDNGFVKWQIASLTVGTTVSMAIEVELSESLAAGSVVRNVALAYKPDIDVPEVADTSTVTVKTKTNNKGLYISKHSETQIAGVGDTIEYAIQVMNTGNSTALNVLVSDLLPPELTFVSATDGGTLGANNVLSWLIGSLDQNESKTMWLKAVLNSNAVEGNTVENIAVAKGENRDSVIVDQPVVIDVGNSNYIIANNDNATNYYYFTGTAIANVLVNDTLNGNPATLSDVEISVLVPFNNENILLDVSTGEVIITDVIPVGTYELTYRICEISKPNNCDDAVVTIEITDDCEMIIPDGFSPNNDGIGDYFRITCIDRYPDAKIEIFNRWGNMVYSKNQYGNIDVWGDSEAWWDGRSQHKWNLSNDLLPVGTYFYVLRLNEGAKPITGSIFLNR